MTTRTRREFLARSTAAGAAVWAAPAILGVPAHAQAGSPACNCSGRAYGLFLTVPILGIVVGPLSDTGQTSVSESNCVSVISEPAGMPIVTANTVCGVTAFGANCTATGSVEDLNVTLTGFPVIQSAAGQVLMGTATAECGCQPPTGSSSIFTVQVGQTTIQGTSTPNQTHMVGGLSVIINEQRTTCRDGHRVFIVNALHVVGTSGLGGLFELIVGHAEVSADCPC